MWSDWVLYIIHGYWISHVQHTLHRVCIIDNQTAKVIEIQTYHGTDALDKRQVHMYIMEISAWSSN